MPTPPGRRQRRAGGDPQALASALQQRPRDECDRCGGGHRQPEQQRALAQLDAAQARLDEAVNKVKDSKDLDEQAKVMQIAIAQENENNRLQLAKAQIEQAKNRAIERAARLVAQHAVDPSLPGLDEILDRLQAATFGATAANAYEAPVPIQTYTPPARPLRERGLLTSAATSRPAERTTPCLFSSSAEASRASIFLRAPWRWSSWRCTA